MPEEVGVPVTDIPDEAVRAVLALMGGTILRESNRVTDWPEDEQDMHRRQWRSFAQRSEAVSRLRAEKIVTAAMPVLAEHFAQAVLADPSKPFDATHHVRLAPETAAIAARVIRETATPTEEATNG